MNRFLRYILTLLAILLTTGMAFSQSQDQSVKIATTYDSVKNKTTVRMEPFRISRDEKQYHSVHISPSFSYPGQKFQSPAKIDFELQTVVKGKLRVDLYVVFIIDGETVFLSSNRSGIKRPVPGRRWMGERLVFNMPYETLLKMAAAKTVQIKMDAVLFELGEGPMQAIRDFATHIQSSSVAQARRAGSQ